MVLVLTIIKDSFVFDMVLIFKYMKIDFYRAASNSK